MATLEEQLNILTIRHGGVCDEIIRLGDLKLLQFARSRGACYSTHSCSIAAQYGHFEILKWCYHDGAPWFENTTAYAAFANRLDILEWCVENNCELSERAYKFAMYKNHVNVMEWLYAHDCPWNVAITYFAASSGNWNTLKWLLERKCPYSAEQLCFAVAMNLHYGILRWLIETKIVTMEHMPIDFLNEWSLSSLKVCHFNDMVWLAEQLPRGTMSDILQQYHVLLDQVIWVPDMVYVIKTYI